MPTFLPHSKSLRTEYELHDYNNLNAIHETEDGGDVHDSTTLLDPSEGAVATTNNDIVSEVYNASMSSRRSFDHDDFQSHAKHSIRSPLLFIRPIIACSWQFIVLVMLIAFIIRTESTAYPIVPRHLETLYVQHPQGTSTAITLIGSLLSLLSTKAFSEAARFDAVVSLGSPGSKSMSLYSLYARITIGSGNTLFHFGKGRRVWTIMSLVSFLLFTVQTAGWTTILTPRATDIPYQTSFQDINYTDALVTDFATSEVARNWAPTWVSGYVAATEGTNMSMQYLSFHDYVLNRTSPRGISPITPTFDNWTRIEAIQQGLKADVNCKATPASDPYIRLNKTAVGHGIIKVSLCCNCTSGGTDSAVVYGESDAYLALAICPISNADNDMTIYLNSNYGGQNSLLTQTCTIRPRWLHVNVTYVREGFVTLEPLTEKLPDIRLTSSSIIQSTVSSLSNHFSNSQTMSENHIGDTIFSLMPHLLPDASDSQYKEFMRKKMADYIRGVFEYGAAYSRSNLRCKHQSGCPRPQTFSSTTYVHGVVWGQAPRFRLIIAISPMAIMIATIIIILASLNKARHLDLDYIASFNAMDTLHIITACSSGNVHTVSFPAYSKDAGVFSKEVEVELTEIKAGSGTAGFHFSHR